MRRRAPRSLAPALEGLRDRLAPRTLLAEVQAIWPAAVGEAITREARPVGERDGMVEVACRSAVWAQELDLMTLDLAARINAALGRDAVRGLRCVAAIRGPR
ncbi:MAG: DciA family protein [Solirubrobacteraceae bacterium]